MPSRTIWWMQKTEMPKKIEMHGYLPAIQRITGLVMPDNSHNETDRWIIRVNHG